MVVEKLPDLFFDSFKVACASSMITKIYLLRSWIPPVSEVGESGVQGRTRGQLSKSKKLFWGVKKVRVPRPISRKKAG
jgi:hypothetical protein